MTRLIIVRHGEPHEGHEREPGDPPLTAEGRRHAGRLAERLAAESIHRIVSSPQRRARETAQPLSDLTGLPVDIVEGLAEVDRGTDRYRSPATIQREEPERWNEFLASPIAFFGLKEGDYKAAVLGAFADLIRPGTRTVAIFSHGTPIKLIVQHALGLPNRADLRIGHCSVTRLSGASLDRLTVESINDEHVSKRGFR